MSDGKTENKIKGPTYKLSLTDLLGRISFDYTRVSRNIENIDNRVNAIFIASTAIITVTTWVVSQFILSAIVSILFIISIICAILSIISSILVLYPRPYASNKGGSDTEKSKIEIPTIEELENQWKDDESKIIRDALLGFIGQIKILKKKVYFYKYSVLLFLLSITILAISLTIIMVDLR